MPAYRIRDPIRTLGKSSARNRIDRPDGRDGGGEREREARLREAVGQPAPHRCEQQLDRGLERGEDPDLLEPQADVAVEDRQIREGGADRREVDEVGEEDPPAGSHARHQAARSGSSSSLSIRRVVPKRTAIDSSAGPSIRSSSTRVVASATET